MQEKESTMVVWCELKILSLGITVRHHSANILMPNSYPHDWTFNAHLTTIKDSYNIVLVIVFIIWAPSSEFVSSSIPSWQILTVHAQSYRGARDLAFCLKVPLDSLLVWASSEGSGETARMRSLAWTFAARIGDKYQIRLTRSICTHYTKPFHSLWAGTQIFFYFSWGSQPKMTFFYPSS